MTLHVESFGAGPEVVLLHGWGLHGGLWQPVLPPLASNFCVHSVDLPGHGFSQHRKPLALASMADDLQECFPRPVTVIGWSLGGLFALEWALRYPKTVEKIVLLASSPCFRQRSDWADAMAPATLDQFAHNLHTDYRGTLKRFLSLQLMGDEYARSLAREMQSRLFERGEPDQDVLAQGLTILHDVDWRPYLEQIQQPCLLIYGARDRLVPLNAARLTASALADARLNVFDDSAHAPHWSHPVQFAEAVKSFIYE